jgi:hypothetical protein
MGNNTKANWSNWYVISIVGSIATLVTFIFPTIANWIGLLTTIDSKLQFFIGVGLTLFTILNTLLASIFVAQNDNKIEMSKLSELIKSDRIQIFKHREKYAKLSELINNAETDVRLMYLHNDRPPKQMSEERKQYEASLVKLLDKSSSRKVKVTRIILCCEKTKQWIKQDIIDKYEGNPKLSLYLTNTPLLSMSIQIIDEEHLITISALAASSSHAKKHFYANSKDLNSVFQMYYEYAKSQCDPILLEGKRQAAYSQYYP